MGLMPWNATGPAGSFYFAGFADTTVLARLITSCKAPAYLLADNGNAYIPIDIVPGHL